MSLQSDLEGLYKLLLEDPRANWFVDLNDPAGAGVRIDPWGEADDLVLSYREWGRPTGVSATSDRITGSFPAGREIYLDSREEHLETNVPTTFPGLKVTLHVPNNRVPNADPDGKIRFAFDVLSGFDLYDFDIQEQHTDPDELAAGFWMPDHIVKSIAVYHKTKGGSLVRSGERHYQLGKAGHIYRPYLRDSLGRFAWGEWEVDVANQKLVKAFDAADLSGASWYEVDADLGYTTKGGTPHTGGGTYKRVSGYLGTAGSNGTASKLWHYAVQVENNKLAVYDGYTNGSNRISNSYYLTHTVNDNWEYSDCSGESLAISNGTRYYIGVAYDDSAAGEGAGIWYDSGGDNGQYTTSIVYANEMTATLSGMTGAALKVSMYIEYTPTATGNVPQKIHHLKQAGGI